MSLEQTHKPSKKMKLGDSDNGIDHKRTLPMEDLENAMTNDQSKVVLVLAQKLITKTILSQKLSILLLTYAFEKRKEKKEIDAFLDVVSRLLSRQNINLRTEEGSVLLHRVIAVGDTALATLLIQADARDTVKNREGGNMLWAAVRQGHHEIAAMLIRSGAQLDLVARIGQHTILQEVLRNPKIVSDAKREELARLILERGVDVNVHDDDGYRALDDAVSHPHCSIRLVEELVRLGARLRKCESDEYLQTAIKKGDKNVHAKLVRCGVDLGDSDNSDNSDNWDDSDDPDDPDYSP